MTQALKIDRLARFSLTTADASRLAAFYQDAFGCRHIATETHAGAELQSLLGIEGGALRITLGLGDEIIELLQFERPGQPYPTDISVSNLIFQHFAVVVTNMELAYQRLSGIAGWSPISVGGPQRLLEDSGGVTAFKFRDMDGHPLELLSFPDGHVPKHWHHHNGERNLFLGIDHSAISVSESERSIAFYEALGLKVAEHSRNRGPEQKRLDAIPDVDVGVTALAPRQDTPHVELLCYRPLVRSGRGTLRNNDIASTRLVFEHDARSDAELNPLSRHLTDPDGHNLLIVPAARSAMGKRRDRSSS